MPHRPRSPESWIIDAISDLAVAKSEATHEILLETLCFHPQQAAEKALKAVLIYSNIPVLKTHRTID
jgi:HEPN domain-containing protein